MKPNPHALQAGLGGPLIMCAICDKLVDTIELFRNEEKQSDVYRVTCHGDKDTCEISDYDRMMTGPQGIQDGVAFTKKRIENG